MKEDPHTPKGAESVEVSFGKFYSAYPRRIGRGAALRAYPKALNTVATRGDPPMGTEAAAEWLAERASAFARSLAGQRGEFTPHPATWLNQARFDDDEREWNRDDRGQRPNDTGRGGWNDRTLMQPRMPDIPDLMHKS